MHDSPDAEDAGICFHFCGRGGGAQPFFFHVNYVFIAPFML